MKTVKLVALLSLAILFMTGIWLIDLGSSALAIQNTMNITLIAKSLTIEMEPNTVYHIGLCLTGICFYILGIMFIFELFSKIPIPKAIEGLEND
jgi:hypothetical protein